MRKEEKKEKRKESFARVDALVKQKGVNFYAISRELGFSRAIFSDWKSGKSMPKTDKLMKIAKLLETTIEYILEGRNVDDK